MIENKELGIKIAEDSNEKFWVETLEKCTEAIATEERNLKINHKILELCKQELQK